MKISDFPLILPVLTGNDVVTSVMEDLNEQEAQLVILGSEDLTPDESQLVEHQSDQEFRSEYPSSVLAEIGSIPDGMHLLEFPAHYEGASCWCRPEVIATDAVLVINHRDLRKGEFDS
jgi:hypothetical protein